MVLYSAVSSPLDRSKRFTLSSPGRPVHSDTVLGFSWKHSSHAAIAQRLFTHISTTVYSQVLIYTAESTEASWIKCPNFETVTTGFEPGLSRLRVRHSTNWATALHVHYMIRILERSFNGPLYRQFGRSYSHLSIDSCWTSHLYVRRIGLAIRWLVLFVCRLELDDCPLWNSVSMTLASSIWICVF